MMKNHPPRGMTMIELLVVVSILGVIAGLATQNMHLFTTSYTSKEDAQFVASAIAGGRGLAYRRNEPVLVTLGQKAVTYSIPKFSTPPTGFTITVPEWQTAWTVGIPSTVTFVSGGGFDVGTTVAFCPSGEYRFLDGLGTTSPQGAGGPVCGIANMANRSAAMRFVARGQKYRINVRAPLATVDLKAGY